MTEPKRTEKKKEVKTKTKIKAKGTVTVAVSKYGKFPGVGEKSLGEDEEQKFLDILPFETEPAYVKVGVGITLKLANKFEFCRLDCSVSVPCYREEINPVLFDSLWNLAEEELGKKIEEVRNEVTDQLETK